MKKNDNAMMKQPWMWLVWGLPATVVLAGFVTAWIAASNPEAIVSEPHNKVGLTIQQAKPEVQKAQ
ncbi:MULTISPECIES: FixH family protein [unclassified Limnobacter]|jgi:hypothetical protein|uniref:FixH family protein n=1 Tax=unclassified Limnobacter TaxID=2630203 RepID=UPI000C375CDE|nr:MULTISPECIES: FixH family protein [unclassified Limnobacter]MAZ10222.1 hypothetical protein [Sutterellaceae bacterium]|tara:strand:- start:10626 stop:10823 length:198 start_codon:yes stop_codon:yes gene_type:complete